MPRRHRSASNQGFLLVEAVLAAVVIGVGLALINQGLGNQLRAVRAAEEYQTLLSLAHSQLIELESNRLPPPAAGAGPDVPTDGVFERPYQAYRWRVEARAITTEDVPWVAATEITLLVDRQPPPVGPVRLKTVWPTSAVPDRWIQR